ncbi:MAG: carboxypeptidase regulatory-like domain-containing protein, partial [Planctomycetota bacterium]
LIAVVCGVTCSVVLTEVVAADAPQDALRSPGDVGRPSSDAPGGRRRRRVSGVAVDAGGLPAPGVTVECFDPADYGLRRRSPVRAKSDDSGRFQFASVPWSDRVLVATGLGFVRTHYLLASEMSSPVTLRLDPGGTISGRVLRDDSVPLSGVRVVLRRPRACGTRSRPKGLDDVHQGVYGRVDQTVTTTEDGSFSFAGVPLGAFELFLDGRSLGRTHRTQTFEVTARDVMELGDLRLPKPKSIRGVVRDTSGRWSPGALVSARLEREALVDSTAWAAVVGADGRFEITGLGPGTYRLEAEGPGLAKELRALRRAVRAGGQVVNLRLARRTVESTDSEAIPAREPRASATAAIEDTGIVVGSLKWSSRRSALVSLRPVAVEGRRFASDEFAVVLAEPGPIRLPAVPSGEYLIRACVPGLERFSRVVRVSSGLETRVDVGLDRSRELSGVVADGLGRRVYGVRLDVFPAESSRKRGVGPLVTTWTGRDGCFKLFGVPRRDVVVCASRPGYTTVESRSGGDQRDLRIGVERTGRLRLRVLDVETRRPLKRFVARLKSEFEDTLRVAVGQNGSCCFEELDPRTQFSLTLQAAEYGLRRERVEIRAGTESTLDFRLSYKRPGGQIRCLLKDAITGSPLPSLRVTVHSPGRGRFDATSDNNGVVLLRGLEPGSHGLDFRVANRFLAKEGESIQFRKQVVVKSGERVGPLVSLKKGATLEGRVVGWATDRLGLVTVEPRGEANAEFRKTTIVERDGSYRVTGLPPGDYEVSIEERNSKVRVAKLKISGRGDIRRDLLLRNRHRVRRS